MDATGVSSSERHDLYGRLNRNRSPIASLLALANKKSVTRVCCRLLESDWS